MKGTFGKPGTDQFESLPKVKCAVRPSHLSDARPETRWDGIKLPRAKPIWLDGNRVAVRRILASPVRCKTMKLGVSLAGEAKNTVKFDGTIVHSYFEPSPTNAHEPD